MIDRVCGRKPARISCLYREDDFALPCSRDRVGKCADASSPDAGLWMDMMDCPWRAGAWPAPKTGLGDNIVLLNEPGDEARKRSFGQLG